MHMASAALSEGRLSQHLHDRLLRLATKLSELLREPEHPSLIHGDVWTTNVLAAPVAGRDRITAFLDPAIYYGGPGDRAGLHHAFRHLRLRVL